MRVCSKKNCGESFRAMAGLTPFNPLVRRFSLKRCWIPHLRPFLSDACDLECHLKLARHKHWRHRNQRQCASCRYAITFSSMAAVWHKIQRYNSYKNVFRNFWTFEIIAKCVVGFRSDLAPSRKAPPPPKTPKPNTSHQDTTDGPPTTGPPKMSQVIRELRQAPPPAATTNDGDYSSIDLVRTAGERARSCGEDGGQSAASTAGQPQHVYGPLPTQSLCNEETDSMYTRVNKHWLIGLPSLRRTHEGSWWGDVIIVQ